MIKFTSPLFVEIPRKTMKPKKIMLNLNVYRNLHYQVNNQAKKIYTEMMKAQMDGYRFNKIQIEFCLYKGSKSKIDRANIYSIVEKFFCDALVNNGCLEDDNDDFIIRTIYRKTEIDKNNPRCEIFIFDADNIFF